MTKRVYLCGPINGCTYEECAMGWRKQVHDELSNVVLPNGYIHRGVEVFSPMRGKEHTKGWDILTGNAYDNNPISTQQAILGRDRYDTFNADLLFCNLLGATKIVSIGSMVEIGWADAKRIPIILCMEKEGNIHDHAFVKGLATYWVHTVEDGIKLAKLLLTPGI